MPITIKSPRLTGIIIAIFGLLAAYYCYANYSLGDLRNLGPGLFPIITGLFISACGIGMAVFPSDDSDDDERVEWRPLFAVSGGVAAFALTIDIFGLVPSIFVLTVISGSGLKGFSLKRILLLSVALSIVAILLFKMLFHVSAPIFSFPFSA